VTPDSPGIPCAMVLTVSFVLSPVTGLFCHRRRRSCLRELDASVGASGPHDFAVRVSAARLRAARVHRIPPPTSVTIAKRPSEEAGRREIYYCFGSGCKRNFGNSEMNSERWVRDGCPPCRHCEERQRRSNPFYLALWIASRCLSSG